MCDLAVCHDEMLSKTVRQVLAYCDKKWVKDGSKLRMAINAVILMLPIGKREQ